LHPFILLSFLPVCLISALLFLSQDLISNPLSKELLKKKKTRKKEEIVYQLLLPYRDMSLFVINRHCLALE